MIFIVNMQKGEPMGRPLDEDMVINIIKNGDYYMTWVDRAMLIEEIKDLPSALSEQKTGHWILLDECANSGYYCSECSKRVIREGWSKTVKSINYCPNCGADMRKK